MSVNSKESVKQGKHTKRFRRIIEIALLLLVVVSIFILVGRSLCKIAIVQIAELTNTKITTDSVKFSINGSVLINGLVVSPGHELDYDDAILRADKVYARFGFMSLLLMNPRLKKINVHDFVFNAQHDSESDHWNLTPLKITPLKGGSGRLPGIRLKSGTLRYSRVINSKPRIIAEIPINARFSYSLDEFQRDDSQQSNIFSREDGYKFTITTAKSHEPAVESIMQGVWTPGKLIVSGGISSTDIPTLEKAWAINIIAAELNYDQNNNYKLKLRIKDLFSRQKAEYHASDLEPVFLKNFSAFNAVQKFFDQYRPWGRIDIEVEEAAGNFYQLSKSTLKGKIICKDVSICKRSFPYLIENITGIMDFTEKSITLNNLRGVHGNVKLSFEGWSKDFGPGFKYDITMKSDNMVLDNDLFQAMNDRWKKPWQAFSPKGLVGIEYVLKRDSAKGKTKSLTVKLDGTDAVYRHFPYPLKNLNGTVSFGQDAVVIQNVVSKQDNKLIELNGRINVTGNDKHEYDITIKADNIPIDPILDEALPDDKQQFYSKLDMANLYGNGILSMINHVWMGPKTKRPQYNMTLYAKKLEINEELLSVLPSSMKKIVSGLRPKGKVDITTVVTRTDSNTAPYDKITVQCLDNTINWTLFPYPLRNITGNIIITTDAIKFEEITAATANNIQLADDLPVVKIKGDIKLQHGTYGKASFDLWANDIMFDDRINIALPEKFLGLYEGLSPTGRFDLDPLHMEITENDNAQKQVEFSGNIILKQCNLKTSPPITDMNARLKPLGVFKISQGFGDIKTTVNAESLRVREKLLTKLNADIFFDGDRGKWNTDNLVAGSYDGMVKGKMEFQQHADSVMDYSIQLGFEDIDLKKYLADTNEQNDQSSGYTSGQMDGSLNLAGKADGKGKRIGSCKLEITDMQVGKLSPLAKILMVLKLTEPIDFAFEQMFVDSFIEDDMLYFRKIDLSGRSLAFNGTGSMNIKNRILDILLVARGERLAKAEPSLLQSLADNIGMAVVKMEVKGDYYDPKVKTTALPVVEDMFNLLGTKENASD
ncbi:MAG: hypothetical protein ACYTBP_11415 [Planctomycetota bacterium]|jgi:hypothetical protein